MVGGLLFEFYGCGFEDSEVAGANSLVSFELSGVGHEFFSREFPANLGQFGLTFASEILRLSSGVANQCVHGYILRAKPLLSQVVVY